MMVTVVQFCEYAKMHCIVHFKWVGFMVCKLHLNKAVIKWQKKKKFQFLKAKQHS